MNVRKSMISDLPRMQEIYAYAREQMKKNGNPTQWGDTSPEEETLLEDIANGDSYVLEQDGVIHGAFSFLLGDDPTYGYIEDGKWLNDDSYGTVHRIASDGTIGGVLHECLKYCQQITQNIRIDTHHDNHIMQHLAEKNGFTRCGIIYIEDGTARIAYQRCGLFN